MHLWIIGTTNLNELLSAVGDREVLQMQILAAHGALVALHLRRCTCHCLCRPGLHAQQGSLVLGSKDFVLCHLSESLTQILKQHLPLFLLHVPACTTTGHIGSGQQLEHVSLCISPLMEWTHVGSGQQLTIVHSELLPWWSPWCLSWSSTYHFLYRPCVICKRQNQVQKHVTTRTKFHISHVPSLTVETLMVLSANQCT